MTVGGFPVGDWQFWVVTAVVAIAVGGTLVRALRRARRRRRGVPRPVRTGLTIEGVPPRR